MAYINRLQAENAELREKLAEISREIRDFRTFLLSDKFRGTDIGAAPCCRRIITERKDWIATGDVDRWLAGLQNMTEP